MNAAVSEASRRKGLADAPSMPVESGLVVSGIVVRSSLKATRWSDRIATRLPPRSRARRSAKMLEAGCVGVAAKLPDALTGGSMVGCEGGPLVITDGNLTSSTGSWLSANKDRSASAIVFGGEKSMTPRVKSQIEAKLKQASSNGLSNRTRAINSNQQQRSARPNPRTSS